MIEENTKTEETATAHVYLTEPLTTEQARVLAERWVAESAIVSFEREATPEKSDLVRRLDPLTRNDRDALRGWVVRRMAAEVERRWGARLDAFGFDRGDPDYNGRAASDSDRHGLACTVGLDTSYDDAWALCEWAGWPS